jgi:hypothetical protein
LEVGAVVHVLRRRARGSGKARTEETYFTLI